MTVVDASESIQLLVFAIAAMAGFGLWIQTRSRPAALLAAAFGLLLTVLATSRLAPEVGGGGVALVRDMVVIGLAVFPWLLAAFAWSFEPGLPRWLWWATGWVGAMAVWILVLPAPPVAGEPRSTGYALFVAAFISGGVC